MRTKNQLLFSFIFSSLNILSEKIGKGILINCNSLSDKLLIFRKISYYYIYMHVYCVNYVFYYLQLMFGKYYLICILVKKTFFIFEQLFLMKWTATIYSSKTESSCIAHYLYSSYQFLTNTNSHS